MPTQADELQAQGFMEIQTLAAVRYGWIPRATCKGVTWKDMIWVSAELQSVDVQDDWWPDHSVLLGKFRGGLEVISRFVWCMPQRPQGEAAGDVCQLAPATVTDGQSVPAEMDPGLAYVGIWQRFEDRVPVATLITSSQG